MDASSSSSSSPAPSSPLKRKLDADAEVSEEKKAALMSDTDTHAMRAVVKKPPRALLFFFELGNVGSAHFQVFAERGLFPDAFDRLFEYAGNADDDDTIRCIAAPGTGRMQQSRFKDVVRTILSPQNFADEGALAALDDSTPMSFFLDVPLHKAKRLGGCIPTGFEIRVLKVQGARFQVPGEGTR